jgi:hypothetical protein
MVATLSLTRRPDLGAVIISINADGRTVTSVQRLDANDSISREVRINAGVLPTNNPPTIIDYEPALVGTVLYIVHFASGSPLSASVQAPSRGTSWLTIPVYPSIRTEVDLITGYDERRETGSIFHDVVDRLDPVVTLSPLRTRAGSIEVWCADYAAARDVIDVHDRAKVILLRQPDHAGLDMYYVVESVSTAPFELRQGYRVRWGVQIGYREVAAPLGDIAANLGWTFGIVAARYSSLAQLPATFATFEDLATEDYS